MITQEVLGTTTFRPSPLEDVRTHLIALWHFEYDHITMLSFIEEARLVVVADDVPGGIAEMNVKVEMMCSWKIARNLGQDKCMRIAGSLKLGDTTLIPDTIIVPKPAETYRQASKNQIPLAGPKPWGAHLRCVNMQEVADWAIKTIRDLHL